MEDRVLGWASDEYMGNGKYAHFQNVDSWD